MKQKIYISENLNNLLAQLGESEQEYVHQMLGYYIKEYQRNKSDVKEQRLGLAVATHDLIQNLIDKKMAKQTEFKISCKKGCSFCCYYSVDITDDEALLLTEFAKEQKVEINYDLLERQNVPADKFSKLPIEDRKCVFLDQEGACSVYEHRPSSCRKLSVISKAKLCDTVKHKGAKVKRFIEAEAEVIACASCNATETGTMAEMLLKIRPE